MEEPIAALPQAGIPAGEPGAIAVQVQETVTAAAPPTAVTKVIVAVHGVGDQHTYATIQSVVNQFCSFHQEPAAIPLGSFHNDQAAFSMQPPFPPEHFQHLAFAEVYWATIPREVVDSKYTLEEAKKWAGTIVERLRMRWRQSKRAGEAREPDFPLLRQVLEEMIETIAVLERLCFLAAKAGLFTFDLRKLLDAYLGDVQVVAEFGSQRKKILDAFAATMAKVHAAHPNAEIFVVAHSEGTVVSFLGLLAAARSPGEASWIRRVRGYMTFGSPLDKHLILWPELFGAEPPAARTEEPIAWRNYYDRGDPIGFALDDVRWWLHHNGWKGVFDFEDEHDIGFIRYPFPGKAHVDYWNDRGVFGHFIRTVVNEPVRDKEDEPGSAAEEPRDIAWTKWLSYVVPYGGVAALFFVAVYVLFKAVAGYLGPGPDGLPDDTGNILRYVGAVAALLFGLTAVSRIPRLTRRRSWRLVGWGIYLLSLATFLWLLPESGPTTHHIGNWQVTVPAGGTRLTISVVVVALVYLVSKRWPQWGIKPLLFIAAGAIAAIVGNRMYVDGPDHGTLWPVFLGAAGFFYLWWLAALILDLVFVWHVYIRQALALQRMDALVGYQARARHDKETKKAA